MAEVNLGRRAGDYALGSFNDPGLNFRAGYDVQ